MKFTATIFALMAFYTAALAAPAADLVSLHILLDCIAMADSWDRLRLLNAMESFVARVSDRSTMQLWMMPSKSRCRGETCGHMNWYRMRRMGNIYVVWMDDLSKWVIGGCESIHNKPLYLKLCFSPQPTPCCSNGLPHRSAMDKVNPIDRSQGLSCYGP